MQNCHAGLTARSFFSWIMISLFGAVGGAWGGQTHFILVGDSHSAGRFGQVFTDTFRSRANVSYVFSASGGAAPLQFLLDGKYRTLCGYEDRSTWDRSPKRACKSPYPTPSIRSLMKQSQAIPGVSEARKVAVVALGANYGMRSPQEISQDVTSTRLLIEEIVRGGYECVWIGPPNAPRFGVERVERHYQLIKKAISLAARSTHSSPCHLIDSRPLSHYPSTSRPGDGSDGLHYDFPAPWWRFKDGTKAAQHWGEQVMHELDAFLK